MTDFNPYQAPNSELPEGTSLQESPGAEPATRGSRLAAAIIDSVISIALFVPFMLFTGYEGTTFDGSGSLMEEVVLQLISIAIYLAINGHLLAKYGQTVGKKLLNIQAVSHSTGQIISFGAMVGKRVLPVWLIAIVPVVGPIIAIVDVLFIFRGDRRCLHDFIADTKVVKGPKS